MRMMDRRWTCILPLAVFLAACDGDADDAPRPPAGEPVTSAAPASDSAAANAPAADSAEAGLAVVVERRAAGEYVMFGRTQASALQLSVEDGHNVLYGPADVEVSGGAFRTDLRLEPTTRPTVFVYITEPGGQRQWVVPIPLESTRVTWGAGAADLQDQS
jgi:hypothetical protein